jgi:lipoprotein NlpI
MLTLLAADAARADTATAILPASDPTVQMLKPCAEGDDPTAEAVACTGLITGGRLTGQPLAAAYVFRGNAQAQRNEMQAAIDDFSQALKIDPAATDALYARGGAYMLLQRDDLALADFAHLLRLVPDDSDTLARRSDLYVREGKYDAALNDLGAVLAGRPDDFETRLQRSGLSIMLSRNADAIADCNRMLKQTPNAPSALYNRGRAEYFNGDFKAAAVDFAAAMQHRQSNPYAALRLYVATARRGRADSAPLAVAAKAYPPDQWPEPVVAFYQGQMSADDLIAAAKVGDPKIAANLATETEFYLGEWALAKRDKDGARRHFQAAIAGNGDHMALEFIDAGLELKQLGSSSK